MPLDALAPDQRAVVQLVLQQERTYDDLAGLLGISADAVRERAHAGLARLGTGDLPAADRGEIADYLLGQQSVSGRERTRSLLASDDQARAWAEAVAAELEPIARSPLPEIPAGAAAPPTAAAAEPEPAHDPAPAAAPERTPEPEEDDDDLVLAPPRARPRPRAAEERRQAAGTPEAARPRPRAERRPGRPSGEPGERRSRSLLGGALLLGGIAIILVAAIILVTQGGDDEGDTAADPSPTATQTATQGEVQPAGQVPLSAPGGGDAEGRMTIYVSPQGQVAFTVEGTDVPQNRRGEAYAIWLRGGRLERPVRLGFVVPPVGEDGRLGTSGPRERDAERFPAQFARAAEVLVTRETAEDARTPGPVILRGQIAEGTAAGAAGGGG